MNKKLISVLAAAVLTVQAAAMPIVANAEAHATYITNSDFLDCAVGGAVDKPIYGLNIICDGSPWLTKGSASRHYQTFMYDEDTEQNYVNMYSNSDKTGTGDGAGSFYMYQRDTTSNFSQTFGYCQFDIRMNSGAFELNYGSFSDPTSNTNYLANTLTFTSTSIKMFDGSSQTNLANINPGKWYTVKIAINNVLQCSDIAVYDAQTHKLIGSGDALSYRQDECTKVCIWCFGYIRGSTYDYDLTNVTISKTDSDDNPYSAF